MSIKYKIQDFEWGIYEVIEIMTILGDRISAYESEKDIVKEKKVFRGSLSDCYSYIKLKEGNYYV